MLEVGDPPAAIATLPASRAGRHSDYSDLQAPAAHARVPVLETVDCNDPATLVALRELRPDVLLVVGWSQVCGKEFLAIPTVGCVGFHPSRLPENRGRAVIPWTILQGARRTGSTLFWLSEGIDDGDILDQRDIWVEPRETAATLYAKHVAQLRLMLRAQLPLMSHGVHQRTPQDPAKASYCARRTPADGFVDWHEDAATVDRLIRACGQPYPGAYTSLDGQRMMIWEATLLGPLPHWARPGQVVAIHDSGIVVQCGDRQHIMITGWELPDGLSSQRRLRPHVRLGT